MEPIVLNAEGFGSASLTVVGGGNIIRLASLNGVLFGGMLYSMEAQFAKHGDRWYPLAGVILTSATAKKVTDKVSTPILEAFAEGVNVITSENPEMFTRFRLDSYETQLQHARTNLAAAEIRVHNAQMALKQDNEWKLGQVVEAERQVLHAQDVLLKIQEDMRKLAATLPEIAAPTPDSAYAAADLYDEVMADANRTP